VASASERRLLTSIDSIHVKRLCRPTGKVVKQR
jgi:hypothetical protein